MAKAVQVQVLSRAPIFEFILATRQPCRWGQLVLSLNGTDRSDIIGLISFCNAVHPSIHFFVMFRYSCRESKIVIQRAPRVFFTHRRGNDVIENFDNHGPGNCVPVFGDKSKQAQSAFFNVISHDVYAIDSGNGLMRVVSLLQFSTKNFNEHVPVPASRIAEFPLCLPHFWRQLVEHLVDRP
jgi:hypothetical protein